jgi:hypothetical protein
VANVQQTDAFACLRSDWEVPTGSSTGPAPRSLTALTGAMTIRSCRHTDPGGTAGVDTRRLSAASHDRAFSAGHLMTLAPQASAHEQLHARTQHSAKHMQGVRHDAPRTGR